MKLSLPTWNAVLLGPSILAVQYLTTPGSSAANRAVAIGLLFFLTPSVIALLIVDVIKLRQHLKARKVSP